MFVHACNLSIIPVRFHQQAQWVSGELLASGGQQRVMEEFCYLFAPIDFMATSPMAVGSGISGKAAAEMKAI